jgi:hypothetical protein
VLGGTTISPMVGITTLNSWITFIPTSCFQISTIAAFCEIELTQV